MEGRSPDFRGLRTIGAQIVAQIINIGFHRVPLKGLLFNKGYYKDVV